VKDVADTSKTKVEPEDSLTGDRMFLLRASAVWLVLVIVESVHGVLRTLLLAPIVGDFKARQISVFTGSLLILTVAYLFVRWIRAGTTGRLLAVGLVWLALTVLFEVALGRLVMGYSWDRLTSDYDLARGGLMPFGLVILTLSPLVAVKSRGLEKSIRASRVEGKPAARRT
jgi:hypothetical protein